MNWKKELNELIYKNGVDTVAIEIAKLCVSEHEKLKSKLSELEKESDKLKSEVKTKVEAIHRLLDEKEVVEKQRDALLDKLDLEIKDLRGYYDGSEWSRDEQRHILARLGGMKEARRIIQQEIKAVEK